MKDISRETMFVHLRSGEQVLRIRHLRVLSCPSRRVQNISSTGSSESHRIRTTLTVKVDRVHFSPPSSGPDVSGAPGAAPAAAAQATATASLQITGPVAVENQHVSMGSYHTLDIEANRDVRIDKEEWDSIALGRVEESCVPGRGAEVGAVVCGEGALSL